LWDWLRHLFTQAKKEAAMDNKIFGFELSGVIAGLLAGIVLMSLL